MNHHKRGKNTDPINLTLKERLKESGINDYMF